MDRRYSNHTADAVPAFTIPLTDEHLIALGRLTAIWSQIDFFIDFAIEKVFSIGPDARHILVGERMIGTKIAILEQGCDALQDSEIKRLALRLAEAAKGIKNKRNHACHGVWAWRTSHVQSRVRVCARQSKSPGTPLKPAELAPLVKLAAQCSQAGADFLAIFSNEPILRPALLFHGAESAPPPSLETR